MSKTEIPEQKPAKIEHNPLPRTRRGGVSAETYSEEDAATYVRKVN